MTEILQLTMERVQDNMDDILTNFKPGAKITVLVRTPGKPTADFCLTSDTLDEVAAMIERRTAETPPPQTMAYRLLSEGEIVQKGDQPLNDDCVSWGELVGWEIGIAYYNSVFVPIRRAVTATEGQTNG